MRSSPSAQRDLQAFKCAMLNDKLDLPLECLCLDRTTITILKREGYSRVYHLFGVDPRSIKGIGDARADIITGRMSLLTS